MWKRMYSKGDYLSFFAILGGDRYYFFFFNIRGNKRDKATGSQGKQTWIDAVPFIQLQQIGKLDN